MDWSKAKNILIIAFIVTNIFLAYALFMTKQDEEEMKIKDEFIGDVVKLLDKEGIQVDTVVPNTTPRLPVISLEYEIYESEEIIHKFLNDYIEEPIEENGIYTDGEKTIRFEDNGKRIIYKDKLLESKPNKKKMSKEEVLKKSKEFINSHGFNLKDAKLSFYLEKDGIYKLEYNKILDGIIVEETNMTLEISNDGVISFERYWTKNIKKGDKVLVASSAPKALLRLLTREEYYGKTIKQIDICYYFNIDEYKKSVGLKDSTGGIASPTWRFVFEDGQKVFLEEN